MVTPKRNHVTPEISEEVLVGFEGGNAEQPYVMGSLYNGNSKAGEFQSDANDVKTIRTRSGHTIELNDKEGEEKINIYDNEGSIITFDTQAKSLFITATENMEFTAKNIKMVAEENIDLQAKGDITVASEGDASVVSKGKIALQAESDINASSKAKVLLEATQDASIKGQNVTAEGKVKAELKGTQTKVAGSATALIQGASGKIDIV